MRQVLQWRPALNRQVATLSGGGSNCVGCVACYRTMDPGWRRQRGETVGRGIHRFRSVPIMTWNNTSTETEWEGGREREKRKDMRGRSVHSLLLSIALPSVCPPQHTPPGCVLIHMQCISNDCLFSAVKPTQQEASDSRAKPELPNPLGVNRSYGHRLPQM